MTREVPYCDARREHVPHLPIDTQPQLEPHVLRDEESHARFEGLAQCLEELIEAGPVNL